MKTKLISLAVSVLGMPILAHAVTAPTAPVAGFCASSASSVATTIIGVVYFALTGHVLPC